MLHKIVFLHFLDSSFLRQLANSFGMTGFYEVNDGAMVRPPYGGRTIAPS